MVALFHAVWASHLRGLSVINNGWLFVDFFFILSGFVISHTYAERLGSAASLYSFVVKRWFRLYPLHIITFVLTMALTVLGHEFDAANTTHGVSKVDLALTLLLVHGLGFSHGTYNLPSWSISAEFWTYVVFGLIMICVAGLRRRAVAMAAIGALALAALLTLNYPNGLFTALEFGALRCLGGFALGTIVWQAWRATSWRPSAAAVTAMLCALLLILWCALETVGIAGNTNIIVVPIFAMLIYACALDTGPPFKWALESPLARVLGRTSYSIYMLHTSVLIVASFAITRLAPDLKVASAHPHDRLFVGDLFCLGYVVAIVLSAVVSHALVEAPFRRIGAHLADTGTWLSYRRALSGTRIAAAPTSLRQAAVQRQS